MNVVRQLTGNDCGIAALAMLAAHHGRPADFAQLAGEVPLKSQGIDLLTLSRLAQRLGLKTRGIQSSYEALATCRLPAIAHLRGPFGAGHFVVLLAWEPNCVTIADPARGLRTISRRRFCRLHSGYLLLADRNPTAVS